MPSNCHVWVCSEKDLENSKHQRSLKPKDFICLLMHERRYDISPCLNSYPAFNVRHEKEKHILAMSESVIYVMFEQV